MREDYELGPRGIRFTSRIKRDDVLVMFFFPSEGPVRYDWCAPRDYNRDEWISPASAHEGEPLSVTLQSSELACLGPGEQKA